MKKKRIIDQCHLCLWQRLLDNAYFEKACRFVEVAAIVIGGCWAMLTFFLGKSENAEVYLTNPTDYSVKVIDANSVVQSGATNSTTIIQNQTVNNFYNLPPPATVEDVATSAAEVGQPLESGGATGFLTWRKEQPGDKARRIRYTVEIANLVERAQLNHVRHNFNEAVSCANKAWAEFLEMVKDAQCDLLKIDPDLTIGLTKILPVLIDEAMYSQNYDRMDGLAQQLGNFYVEKSPYVEAMRRIARLKKSGGKLIFFESKELAAMKGWDKSFLWHYLNILAQNGYLQPLELSAADKGYRIFPHSLFFKLPSPVVYQPMYRIDIPREEKTEIASNQVAGQWDGLDRVAMIDIDEIVAEELGLDEGERAKHPFELVADFKLHPIGKRFESMLHWNIVHAELLPKPEKPSHEYYSILFKDDIQLASIEPIGEFNEQNKNRIPEPSSGLLLLIGIAVIALKRTANRFCP